MEHKKCTLQLTKREMGEAEKICQRNLEDLIEIVQDIDRAGKMIGKPTLLMDFLYHILFVIGSMDRPEMISLIGKVPQQAMRKQEAAGKLERVTV